MVYPLALLFAVAVGGWLALEVLLGEVRRRESVPIGALGLAGAIWAGAELLLLSPAGPEERLFARRLLYLGAAFLPPLWLWASAQALRPAWLQRRPQWVALAFAPAVLFYSLLFGAGDGLLIGWTTPEPSHGPLFPWYAAYAWSLILAGLAGFAATARRLDRLRTAQGVCLLAGALLPLASNMLYLGAGFEGWDPTPAVLGPAGILIRLGVVDSGLSQHLPLARGQVVDQLDVGIALAGRDGRVLDGNPAAARLAGVEELRGAALDELERRARERVDLSVEARRMPLRSRAEPVGEALILADRSEADTAQRRLHLAARLEALGSLTAGIAHEVNNPLAYIQSNLSQLAKTAERLAAPSVRAALPDDLRDEAAEASHLVTDTQEGIGRIHLLVRRLKGFARDDGGRLRPTPVWMAEVAGKAASMAGVGLPDDAIRVHDEGAPPITTSEGAVLQILLNLLLNAVQAGSEAAQVEVRVAPAEDGVAMEVLDRGPGIPPADLPHLFDPFFTTKPGGTGLGLSLSFDLACQLGGRLEAENRTGGGARFRLWLPPVPPGERAAEPTAPPGPDRGSAAA